MATVSQLSVDLSALAHEVKRKNHDVRSAIDHAVAEIKQYASNTIISGDIHLQVAVCLPFITALSSSNTKLINLALLVLLRLATLRSLNVNQLLLIIDSLYSLDVPVLSFETQLKILQAAPPLTENYSLDRDHFLRLLAICGKLTASAHITVSNTASATLQQVISSRFDKLRNERRENGDIEQPKTCTVVVIVDPSNEKVDSFQVNELEMDCFHVFLDLTTVVEGGNLEFIEASDIPLKPQTALEVIESIISLNGEVFEAQPELSALLKSKTIPVLLNVINSPNSAFPLVARTLRILQLLVASHMELLQNESEIVISAANHIMLSPSAISGDMASAAGSLPYWEKVLVLEFFKGIFSNFASVRQIYDIYDSDPKKKNVLHEALTVFDTYLQNNFSQFFHNDIIQVPPERPSANQLSKSSATMKISVLDHLDKSDPPTNIPSLYSAHLIFKLLVNFADGVSDFVTNLSANSNSATLENDVEFITTMNEEVFSEIFQLFKKYIYCLMDSEYFHSCIRALQKYTHAIGLLGLSSLRDGLLLTLSDCCIKNSAPDETKKNGASHLLSIGESIVESLSSTIQAPSVASSSAHLTGERSSTVKSPGDETLSAMRTFNTRQVVCLRALSNLALSLGSTLQGSWKIVWITFQWVDYFLNGPDQFSGYPNLKDIKKYGEPRLSSQDLQNMESSKARFLDSINEYQQSSYNELVHVLAELYDGGSNSDKEKVIPLTICPFNKTYFVDQLIIISQLNPRKFLFNDEKTWNQLVDYFTTLGTNRSISYSVRNYLVNRFTEGIVDITEQGFQAHDDKLDTDLAEKSLNALLSFLQRLLALGRPQEHLVLNCETEIHLTVLTTVHGLIDGYVEKYQNSWDLVFEILNTAFVNTSEASNDTNLNDKILSLISTSFGTLKLILDEFLTTLPTSQLKSLIDTLLNFCSQNYDLNISFSSVSYFWLISDCINNKIGGIGKENLPDLESLTSILQLQTLLEDPPDSEITNQALNIYLLAQLSNLSTDKRARVREGAVQTLFQIVDVQGKQLLSWKMIYDIVLPGLLDLSLCFEIAEKESREDAMESLKLVLSGLVSVYTKFMLNFDDHPDLKFDFWKRLMEYFHKMFQLNWKGLNLKIFQSYQDLIQVLSRNTIPSHLGDLFFEFWVNVSIDYDFVNPEYQDSLAVYNASFEPLYRIVKEKLTLQDSVRVLSNLNKCARYPVLKPNLNDSTKPTELQLVVLRNLLLIDKKGPNEQILAGVIQQLGVISSYPFETRSRIEAKLKNVESKLKIPTFVGVSEQALEMLNQKLRELSSIAILLEDHGFSKLVRSLLFLVHHKAQGISGNTNTSSDPLSPKVDPLWVRCNDTLFFLVENLMHDKIDIDPEVWQLVVECITVCFEQLAEAQEIYNVQQYEKLTQAVLPVLFSPDVDQHTLVDQFVYSVYVQSYLYEMNDIEKALVGTTPTASKLEATYAAFADFPFDASFGTTAPLTVHANRDMRLACLGEIFTYACAADRSSPMALTCLLARSAFALRRFTADESLLLRKPLPKIQQEELRVVLQGLLMVQNHCGSVQMAGVHKLLAQSVPYLGRVDDIAYLVEAILES